MPNSRARGRRAGDSKRSSGALGGDERARAREIDLLRYQLAEIDDAHITGPDEDERLAAAGGDPRRRRGAP